VKPKDDAPALVAMAEWIAAGECRGIRPAARRAAATFYTGRREQSGEQTTKRLHAKFASDRAALMAAVRPRFTTILTEMEPIERYRMELARREKARLAPERQSIVARLHLVSEVAARAAVSVAEGRLSPEGARAFVLETLDLRLPRNAGASGEK
jgi:hypothetical protein